MHPAVSENLGPVLPRVEGGTKARFGVALGREGTEAAIGTDGRCLDVGLTDPPARQINLEQRVLIE